MKSEMKPFGTGDDVIVTFDYGGSASGRIMRICPLRNGENPVFEVEMQNGDIVEAYTRQLTHKENGDEKRD